MYNDTDQKQGNDRNTRGQCNTIQYQCCIDIARCFEEWQIGYPADYPGRSTSRPGSRGRKLTRRLQAVRKKQKLEDAAAICDSDIGHYSLIVEAVLKSATS